MDVKNIDTADTTMSDHSRQKTRVVLADGGISEFEGTNVVAAGETAEPKQHPTENQQINAARTYAFDNDDYC